MRRGEQRYGENLQGNRSRADDPDRRRSDESRYRLVGDLPPSMKEAIDQFRAQVGAAIDSVEFVKRALDTPVPETDCEEGLVDVVEVDRSQL